MAFDLVPAFGTQNGSRSVTPGLRAMRAFTEHRPPKSRWRLVDGVAEAGCGDVLSQRVAFVAMDSAFALLKVTGLDGQVPSERRCGSRRLISPNGRSTDAYHWTYTPR